MQPTHYEITVRGQLGAALIEAFDGLIARPRGTDTVLCGEITDQAQLYGVRDLVESLGLELLDIHRTAHPFPQGGSPCRPC